MKEQFSKLFGLAERSSSDEVKQIPVGDIVGSPYQPRTIFDDEKIDELCQTIKTHRITSYNVCYTKLLRLKFAV